MEDQAKITAWVTNHINNLQPYNFYYKFGYSFSSRHIAEADLQAALHQISQERNVKKARKAKNILARFEVSKSR